MCIQNIKQKRDVDNGRRSTYHRPFCINVNHRISRKFGVTMKSVGHILSIVIKIVTIPLVIFAFIKRYAIKEKVKGFDPHSLKGISDRIFDNGVSALWDTMKNGADHDE